MRKLWNRPASAVWSLVTKNQAGESNLNICTYVTSVSMAPKLILVAVYHGTKTRENLVVGQAVLLQLLSESLAPVVRVAGQQSGHQVKKWQRLAKRYEVGELYGLPYLKSAAGVMTLKVQEIILVGGDHDLMVGVVEQAKNLNDVPILTTEFLKREGYTR